METSKDGSFPNGARSEIPKHQKVYHFLIMGAATIVILAGIRAASGIVAPMLLALFLSVILLVPLRWLQKKGCPNIISLVLVIGCSLAIFLGIGMFVGKSLNDFLRHLPIYKDRITRKVNELDKKLEQYGFVLELLKNPDEKKPNPQVPKEKPLGEILNDQKPDAPKSNSTPQENAKEKKTPKVSTPTEKTPSPPDSDPLEIDGSPLHVEAEQFASDEQLPAQPDDESQDSEAANDIHVDTSEDIDRLFAQHVSEKPSLIALNTNLVMYWSSKSVLELKHLVESGLIVMIITLFMIFEAARFPEKIDRAFGKEGPIRNEHFHHIAAEIRRYLFLKTISSVMSGFAATVVYFCFGVPGAMLWGFIAFFLYFIPNLGGIIAAIIPALLIFMSSGLETVLLYAICLVAIECTIGYGIEPKMLGHGLGISTVVILLSLFFWGWILGPVGLFLAAPLTIMVKIILQAFKETEWIAILLDDGRSKNSVPGIHDTKIIASQK